ncbi:hypothetical protein BST36_25145 [Mycolicibacterium moriokaense]|uniref:Uncharacterized protein n=1 Tax=Mycolicibacterium moriokaense TaxID=39691 RepID=A0AAD1M459_9MYCO|nr:hypothetical protein [Mycolicibacterium moriokaense]MCV7039557.1 hypothetical protein [Mycolicibacterium moriokaense]ORB17288.1 hypothetical protein BST36_25145 [Mycolicibacterium moriokaense]BBW99747.1 hypothetical protein MMOR_06840 [Mycolicibacterium moriokaense]
MKLGVLRLRQRDAVTCGPSVALMAGALLDPRRHAALADPVSGAALFDAEQRRVHADVNRIWPRRLGTTPWGVARALTAEGATAGVWYRWRLFRGPLFWGRLFWGRRDSLSDVIAAARSGLPVAMLVGRVIPRHWVLIVDASEETLRCYEPSSGEVRSVDVAAVRESRLTGLGFPRPFAFVLPYSNV